MYPLKLPRKLSGAPPFGPSPAATGVTTMFSTAPLPQRSFHRKSAPTILPLAAGAQQINSILFRGNRGSSGPQASILGRPNLSAAYGCENSLSMLTAAREHVLPRHTPSPEPTCPVSGSGARMEALLSQARAISPVSRTRAFPPCRISTEPCPPTVQHLALGVRTTR